MARPRKQYCIDNHGDEPERYKSGACKACLREHKASGFYARGGNRTAQRQRDKARKRAALAAYRQERGCARCGAVEGLHLHHRDPSTKVADLSSLVQNRASWRQIWDEVAKCDVLCAGCHVDHHRP